MAFGWEGKKVRLVPLDKERHLENAVQWMNDPEVTHFLLIGDYPITRVAEEKFFERRGESQEDDIIWAVETREGKHIGFSGLHQISHMHKTAISGTVLGDKECWGQGYGTDAARVRARYAFEVLNLRLVMSAVLEGNERSLRMQESVGYEVVGRIPQKFWKRGQYRDEIITCLRRENFKEG